MKKCPNCGSKKVVCLGKDIISVDGESYSHKCLECESYITRDEINESYQIGKEVLLG